MELNGEFIFLGATVDQSKDGMKFFKKVSLLQGIQSHIFFVDDEIYSRMNQLQPMTKLQATIGVTFAKDKIYLGLKDFEIIK